MLNVSHYIRHFVHLNYHYFIIIIIKLHFYREAQHIQKRFWDLIYKIILGHLLPATRGC